MKNNPFAAARFWKIYFFIFALIGLLVTSGAALDGHNNLFTPAGIADSLLSAAEIFILYFYAFQRRIGYARLLKLIAFAFPVVDLYYNLYQYPLSEHTQLLSGDWWGTLVIMLLSMGPAYFAAIAYSFGKLPVNRPKAQDKTSTPIVNAPKAPRGIISLRTLALHPLLGWLASFIVIVVGILSWLGLNGMDRGLKLIDAEGLYTVLATDHVTYWLISSTAVALWFTHQRRHFRASAYAMVLLLLPAVGLDLYMHKVQNETYVPRVKLAQVDPNFHLDPRIMLMSAELGIDTNNLKQAKAHVGVPSNLHTACGNSDTIGCFDSEQIYVYPQSFNYGPAETRSTLAHEYLHWVWYTSSRSDREQITPYLNIFYGEHQAWFDERMKSYTATGMRPGSAAFTDELHAYIGSEVDRNLLPSELKDWYAKWVPKSETLPKNLK